MQVAIFVLVVSALLGILINLRSMIRGVLEIVFYKAPSAPVPVVDEVSEATEVFLPEAAG